jgi:hypothetical protein
MRPGKQHDAGMLTQWRLMQTAKETNVIQANVKEWSVNQPVPEDYLIFGSPQILESEIKEVVATLHSVWIGTGPRVAKFEKDVP